MDFAVAGAGGRKKKRVVFHNILFSFSVRWNPFVLKMVSEGRWLPALCGHTALEARNKTHSRISSQ